MRFNVSYSGGPALGKATLLASLLEGQVLEEEGSRERLYSLLKSSSSNQTNTFRGRDQTILHLQSYTHGTSSSCLEQLVSDLEQRHVEWRKLDAQMLLEEERAELDTRHHLHIHFLPPHADAEEAKRDLLYLLKASPTSSPLSQLVPLVLIVTKGDAMTSSEKTSTVDSLEEAFKEDLSTELGEEQQQQQQQQLEQQKTARPPLPPTSASAWHRPLSLDLSLLGTTVSSSSSSPLPTAAIGGNTSGVTTPSTASSFSSSTPSTPSALAAAKSTTSLQQKQEQSLANLGKYIYSPLSSSKTSFSPRLPPVITSTPTATSAAEGGGGAAEAPPSSLASAASLPSRRAQCAVASAGIFVVACNDLRGERFATPPQLQQHGVGDDLSFLREAIFDTKRIAALKNSTQRKTQALFSPTQKTKRFVGALLSSPIVQASAIAVLVWLCRAMPCHLVFMFLTLAYKEYLSRDKSIAIHHNGKLLLCLLETCFFLALAYSAVNFIITSSFASSSALSPISFLQHIWQLAASYFQELHDRLSSTLEHSSSTFTALLDDLHSTTNTMANEVGKFLPLEIKNSIEKLLFNNSNFDKQTEALSNRSSSISNNNNSSSGGGGGGAARATKSASSSVFVALIVLQVVGSIARVFYFKG